MQIPIIGPSGAWTSQPRLNPSHPLTRMMTDCLLWTAGGIPVNFASPNIATTNFFSAPSLTAWGYSGYATAGSYYGIPDHGNYAAGDFTIRVRFVPVSFPGAYTTLFTKTAGLGSYEIATYINSSRQIQYIEVGGAYNAANDNINVGDFTLSVVHDYVMTRIGSTVSLYIDGILVKTLTISTTGGISSPLNFGLDVGGNTNGNNKYLATQIWKGRGLTQTEVSQLYLDPYGFLIYPEDEMLATLVGVASSTAVVTGWQNISSDVYTSKPQKLSASPAFISTFRTASISGMAWHEPPDPIKIPPNAAYSLPAAFARVPDAVNTISGISWFEPWDQSKARPTTLEAFPSIALTPSTLPPIIAGMAWFEPTIDKTSQGRFLTDPVGYGHPAFIQAVGISGISWFEPPDLDKPPVKVRIESFPAIQLIPNTLPTPVSGIGWFNPFDEIKVKVSFDRPSASPVRPPVVPISGIGWFNPLDTVKARTSVDYPSAFVVKLPPTVPVSGISWFEPPDRDKAAFKSYLESLPSVVLTPGTAPTPISGIAWFEPLPNTVNIVLGFSSSPAFQQAIIQLVPEAILHSGKWRWLEGVQELNNLDRLLPSVKEAAAILSSAGGHARAKSLTQTQRSNIASNAAKVRWK